LLNSNLFSSWHFHNSFPIFHGLMTPSLFIRNLNVERLIPSRSAAPFRPAITHFVFFKVSRIRSRSVSAIVFSFVFNSSGISPTSSRKIVPWFATSNRPIRCERTIYLSELRCSPPSSPNLPTNRQTFFA
jgi:hypothetical protein